MSGPGPLMRAGNGVVKGLLRSPLHGLMSRNTLVLTVKGRKSGREISLPVGYVMEDSRHLLVTSQRDRRWWRNLRGGRPVTIYLRGVKRQGQGVVLEEAEAVAQGLTRFLQKAPRLARYFGLSLDQSGHPEQPGLAKASRERVVIELTLE